MHNIINDMQYVHLSSPGSHFVRYLTSTSALWIYLHDTIATHFRMDNSTTQIIKLVPTSHYSRGQDTNEVYIIRSRAWALIFLMKIYNIVNITIISFELTNLHIFMATVINTTVANHNCANNMYIKHYIL